MKRFVRSAIVFCFMAGAWGFSQNLRFVEVITSPQRTEFLRGLLDEFEAQNPGVTVELVSLPWEQSFERLLTMVQGGDAPDIVELPDRWLALYASSGYLADLTPYVDAWGGGDNLTDRAWEVANAYNGTTYFIPYGFYLRAMFYNRNLFEQADVSEPPTTIDEFLTATQQVAGLDGNVSGYCLRGGRGSFDSVYMFMSAFMGSGEWFDEEGNSTFSSPEAIQGIEFLVNLYREGLAPRDSINWGFNEIVAGFYTGQCAMLDQDPDALIGIQDRMPEEAFDVAPMPLGPDGKAFPKYGSAGWAIFESSENKDLAWALESYLLSPEVGIAWSKYIGIIPIHQGAEEDPFYANPKFGGWFTQLNDPNYAFTLFPYHLPELGYFFDVISKDTFQEALLGDKTAEEVANEWATYLTDAQQKWLASQE